MSKTREYIKEKNIELLFEDLMRHVINEKPDNPVTYLIEVLQKKVVFKKSRDGPRISLRNQRSDISCSGTAIDIRASLERILPRACQSTPVTLDNERSRSAPPNTEVLPSKEETSASPAGEGQDTLPLPGDGGQDAGDVVVTQEYVQNVQSIFDFSWGKKKKESIKTAEVKKVEDTRDKQDKSEKKKKKKKKKKRSGSDSEISADENEKIIDVILNQEKNRENEEETNIKDVISKEAPVGNEEPTEDQEAVGPSEENGETDDVSVLMTASCDLTELGSWGEGELHEESVMSAATAPIEESSFRNVESAAPPLNIISSQAEELGLSDEISTTLRRHLHKPAVYNTMVTSPPRCHGNMVTSPPRCHGNMTMFFEEPDTDIIPSVEEVSGYIPVFSVPKIEKKQEPCRKQKRSDSDELSISDFSACPWTYAESIS